MKKWARRISYVLITMVCVGLGLALAGKLLGERKLARQVAVPARQLEVAADPARVGHGRYLFNTRGCADCHGANGAGQTVLRDGAMLVVSPNISPGENSVTRHYRAADWVRTVRHGVKPDGTPVMIMPSEDYNRLSDADMAALLAYLTQLPPAPGVHAVIKLPVRVKALYALGAIKDAAEKIDHAAPPPAPVEAGISAAHGAYLANTCMGCHGPQLAGGTIPGAPSAWPPTANLTPGKGSVMPRYPSPELFMATLRSGKRPDGSAISEVMPFGSLKQMTDTDLRALYAYLKTLPPHDSK
ncbi:MAG: cytochrome [Massilia sp.]|nr:cytochrome [Massilia sp.]